MILRWILKGNLSRTANMQKQTGCLTAQLLVGRRKRTTELPATCIDRKFSKVHFLLL